ncbi:lipocalin family protein [Flavivirga eckloniae]|uniref:Lipocalin n=1 Tax=Flavivirga eckloniae TaxID=1803846 RepID=A0A2K9PR12_9FLAO|nr:lipocalin family protein [Flavivirga eckloniae]AUP79268.1 lipocalin [Flavivirga eckloniae]
MKNTLLFLIAISLISCGTPKTVRVSKKVIKGDWLLNSITYSEKGTYNVNLLNDDSKECFEGSTWQFVPNNNRGVYNINGIGCSAGARNFIFTIKEIDPQTGLYDFLLKPTNEKYKSDTNQGFRLRLAALSDMAMEWEQTVTVSGKPFTITMKFNKQ